MQIKWHKTGVFLTLIAIGFGSLSFAQQGGDEELFVISINGRAGLVNRSGQLVIKPEFRSLGDFNKDCGCIWAMDQNRLWGTIDLQGRWMIPPKYSYLSIEREGYRVSKEPGKLSKYRFIDNHGSTFFDEYEDAKPFSEGLAAVKVNNKWGYIDTQGKYVISPQYNQDDARESWRKSTPGDFSEGLAAVKKNGQQVYIRRDNTVAINLRKAMNGGDFSHGRAIVWEDEKFGLIDTKGKLILSPTYNQIEQFSEGLAAFRLGVSWGYLNQNGEIVIKPTFDYAEEFACGLAPVKVNEKWGFVDKWGKLIIEPKYDSVGRFQHGLVKVESGGADFFIDKDGRVVIKVSPN